MVLKKLHTFGMGDRPGPDSSWRKRHADGLLQTMNKLGRVLFAFGLAGLGVLSLNYRSFALVWQPVPGPFPHRELLAVISGSILVVGGICMLLPRLARWATFGLTVFLSSWLPLQIGFNLWKTPSSSSAWTTLAETVILISGGWILFGPKMQAGNGTDLNADPVTRLNRRFQMAFALALPVISISHFVYAFSHPAKVPQWIPFYVGFAFLTGIAHAAAGVGILTRIASHLAASLEAIMIGLFALVLHLPLIALQPTNRLYWTTFFIATACSGGSFIVASSIPKTPKASPAAI